MKKLTALIIFLIIIVLGLGFYGYFNQKKPEIREVTPSTVTYDNPEYKISFEYPYFSHIKFDGEIISGPAEYMVSLEDTSLTYNGYEDDTTYFYLEIYNKNPGVECFSTPKKTVTTEGSDPNMPFYRREYCFENNGFYYWMLSENRYEENTELINDYFNQITQSIKLY